MAIKSKVGYDIIDIYQVPELERMYKKEGMDSFQAHNMAVKVAKGLNSMRITERRFWQNVREHESTAGIDFDGVAALDDL